MGVSSSRMESRHSRRRVNRSSLSSLLCGASSSRASYQMERHSENSHEAHNHRVEPSVSVSASRSGISGSNSEIGANRDSCFESGLRGTGMSSTSRYMSECNELICPRQVSDALRRDESFRVSNHRASESRTLPRDQQSSNTASVSDDSVHNGADSVSDSRSADQIFTPSASFQPSSGLGLLVSNRERARSDDSVLHLDVLSISSNVLPNSSPERSSNLEARRSSRRMFWDAFSRRSSRRLLDSPTIVFSMDENEEVGSRDGWVFGLSGDFFDDGNGSDSGYLGRRNPFSTERRRHSRSEVWERLRSGRDENVRRNAFCPSGLHPDGACSCESLLSNEESSTRASISRIVMLAEALFEVLDEIHRQPVSLSVSMVSSPAPESIVDSLPLKSHSTLNNGKNSDDAAECYICLAEYDEGDKIRVLPCRHEYHMSCVDKWLKEIHGVCPLCRGDVREGLTDVTK